ncbi:MAG TPA: T9SS type A sorting domain-containing protein [Puia sp.]|nr:T9SS type A sorting domain-containing protein [Puia sp.]
MRQISTLTTSTFLIVCFLSNRTWGQNMPMESTPVARAFADRAAATPILPTSVNKDWYGQAVANISTREYNIRTFDQPGVYAAVNHAQHLSYVFTDRGYAVKNFNEDGSVKDTWRVQLLVAGIGRKSSVGVRHLRKSGPTGDRSLSFDYGDYMLTYNNGNEGMEQRFILNKRPAGNGGLQIEMAVGGDLQAAIGDKDQLLLCRTGDKRSARLVYDQLKVWDKNKKILPSHMSLTGNRLVLSVDDRNAVYPLTVDPLNHVPGWNGIGTGMGVTVSAAAPMLYGYSVSGAGDVNNDGIADIIVGAPTYTKVSTITITGSDLTTATVNFSTGAVGAAFVYYGQNTVMPLTVASRVLQPTGLALGALFGFSVSTTGKIDANNSGVVIGAPGDQVTLNNLFLIPTLYPVGKVYVYSGTTFTTGDVTTVATTPTNTLTLSQADFNSSFLNAGTFLSPLYGFSVSNGGTIKGGTIGSILVGCPFYPDLTFLVLEGRTDIYYGTGSGLNPTPTKLLGDPSIAKNAFGFSLSSAGDVNGDGFGDIIIGAPGVGSLSLAGKALIYTGSASGINTTVATTLTSGASIVQSLFGYSVSGGGDVNGDTKSDVIVGEPLSMSLALGSPLAAGKAYVFYSGPGAGVGIQTTGSTTLTSPRLGLISGNLLFGFSVAMLGDVNGDTRSDVLVGEPGNQPLISTLATSLAELPAVYNTTVSGQAYIFASDPSGIIASGSAPIWTLQTAPEAPLLGASVHTAGDVNNDGVQDYLIGAPNAILSLQFDLTLPGGAALSVGTGSGSGLIESSGTIDNTINSGNAYLFSGTTVNLPVILLTFTGQAEGSDVLLNWSTAQEQNSDYFQIERSADNQNFTAIGKVTAAHNSSLQTNYSFTDASPLTGNNYYRLKMVDIDGSSVYSRIVVVSFGNTSQQVIATYPNPAHGSFQLLFKNMTPGRYAMNLINPSGQIIFTRNIQVADAQRYNESINLNPSLAQGTYVIRVVDQQNHSFITRIVIN